MHARPRFGRLVGSMQSGPSATKEIVVRSVVVYESRHGNTRLIAESIAEGLGGVPALAVHEAADQIQGVQLIVVGGQTQPHALAAEAGRQASGSEPLGGSRAAAVPAPRLREWLRELPRADGVYAAAFDTRVDKPRWLTGDAAHSIARRLASNGYGVLGAQSFLIEDAGGPLRDGERERARAFGERLALSLSAPPVTRRRAAMRGRSRRRQGLHSTPGG